MKNISDKIVNDLNYNPLIEKFGELAASKMTYNQVIKHCKRMWNEKRPGIEKWSIWKEELKEN